MSNTQFLDIESALLDVRKSFRLLHAYQTRVLDLVRYISQRMGLNFRSGWPWYTDNYQKGGKVHLDNWAFDWLYMYLYEFNLLDERQQESGLVFSLLIIPDTGFFDKEMAWGDRNLVRNFNSVEQSQSRILFMAGKNKWHPGAEKMMPLFRKDADFHVDNSGSGVFLAKSYPLSNFMNATSSDSNILDFVSFCSSNGITELAIQEQV